MALLLVSGKAHSVNNIAIKAIILPALFIVTRDLRKGYSSPEPVKLVSLMSRGKFSTGVLTRNFVRRL